MAHSQQRQQPDAPTKSERVSQSVGKGKGNNSNWSTDATALAAALAGRPCHRYYPVISLIMPQRVCN